MLKQILENYIESSEKLQVILRSAGGEIQRITPMHHDDRHHWDTTMVEIHRNYNDNMAISFHRHVAQSVSLARP